MMAIRMSIRFQLVSQGVLPGPGGWLPGAMSCSKFGGQTQVHTRPAQTPAAQALFRDDRVAFQVTCLYPTAPGGSHTDLDRSMQSGRDVLDIAERLRDAEAGLRSMRSLGSIPTGPPASSC